MPIWKSLGEAWGQTPDGSYQCRWWVHRIVSKTIVLSGSIPDTGAKDSNNLTLEPIDNRIES